jgi:hypothetical protein
MGFIPSALLRTMTPLINTAQDSTVNPSNPTPAAGAAATATT